jgi:2-polyprenyl-3-methyl-5-hydroxy-6-metoxy-1,4-benzoquinol methylase
MSTPLSPLNKKLLHRSVVKAHQMLSHNARVRQLALLLEDIIDHHTAGLPAVRCLDVGCGDMTLAEQIQRLCPRTSWQCIDLYELPPELQMDPRWLKYRQFDGQRLPFGDNSFDIVLLCDVLHHSGTEAGHLLREAGRVGGIVLVKDHIEESPYSRLMLWLMDFVGNWGYGVKLPKKYFTVDSFARCSKEQGLRLLELNRGIDLYAHLPVLRTLLRPSWHFIALLKALKKEK